MLSYNWSFIIILIFYLFRWFRLHLATEYKTFKTSFREQVLLSNGYIMSLLVGIHCQLTVRYPVYPIAYTFTEKSSAH